MIKFKLLCFYLIAIVFFGIYNVSAIKQVPCTYNTEQEHSLYVDYELIFEVSGDYTKMVKCTRKDREWETSSSCDDYIFDSKTYSLDREDSCPAFININGIDKKITWVENKDTTYTYKLTKIDEDNIKDVGQTSCLNYTKETSCEDSISRGNVSCIWVKNESAPGGGYCNVDNLLYVGCGGAQDIPMQAPQLISLFVNLLKIATPIILIFISIITLFKALAAQKEDEIKKATSSLVKKMISAALVFFVISIVQFVISKVAEDADYKNFSSCLNCFLNNSCATTTYYKTVVSGEDYCTYLTEGETKTCDCLLKGICE